MYGEHASSQRTGYISLLGLNRQVTKHPPRKKKKKKVCESDVIKKGFYQFAIC
jgi:hypothetical protein